MFMLDHAGLIEKSKGDDVLEEYKTINTLSSGMKRALITIGHITERHGISIFKIIDCHA